MTASSLDNDSGALIAGDNATIDAGAQLTNAAGHITAAQTAALHAVAFDNSEGTIDAGQLALNATDLTNRGGTLTQTGVAAMNATVANTFDNTGGLLQTNGQDLSLTAATLVNDQGQIGHAGNGTLTVKTGALSNQRGSIATNGVLDVQAADVDNRHGVLLAAKRLALQSKGRLDNAAGSIQSNDRLVVQAQGAVNNSSGQIGANGAAATLALSGTSIDNRGGRIVNVGTGTTVIDGGALITNRNEAGTAGVIGGNGDVVLTAQTLSNTQGGQTLAGHDLTLDIVKLLDNAGGVLSAANDLTVNGTHAALNNRSGTIRANGKLALTAASIDNSDGAIGASWLVLDATDLTNRGGTLTQTGMAAMKATVANTFDNTGGLLQTNGKDLSLTAATLVNDQGQIGHAGNGTLTVKTGALSNQRGSIATNGALDMQAAALSNLAGTLSAQQHALLVALSFDNRSGGYLGADSIELRVQDALGNAGGVLEARSGMSIGANRIANDGGVIRNIGASTLSLTSAQALTNTANGTIASNGDVSITAGDVDNTYGALFAAKGLTLQSNGQLDNAAGSIQSNDRLVVQVQGAVNNSGGQIEANGAAAALALSGTSIDNRGGRIVNVGTGTTTIDGGASITNTNEARTAGAGVIGGNGDVVFTTQTLSNTQGGQTLAGHDLTLDIVKLLDNAGGVLSAANDLTVNGTPAALSNRSGTIRANGKLALTAASIDDTGGKIGNDPGRGGSIVIWTRSFANQGSVIGSDLDLSLVTDTLVGDGSIVAGRNGNITLSGDYTQHAANRLHANGDLTLTTSGKLTNQGTLDANGALTIHAANVDNQSGADLNSAATSVNAVGGTIGNAGRIEGDRVATDSMALANTAAIVGRHVTLNADYISNTGAAAVIAAAQRLDLYATNQLSNTAGANLFSIGDLYIAANGQRDANGFLVNRTQAVLNDQSTIEAQGNIELAAGTFTNTRPAPVVQTETTSTSAKHETKRGKYVACTPGGPASTHSTCPQAVWNYGYNARNDTFNSAQVISKSAGPNATDRVLVIDINGQQRTIYYNTLTDNGNGTFTVNYWDAYDPHVNYVPDSEYPARSDAHNGYQRIELARDTKTTIQQDQLISQVQPAQFIAGGNIVLKHVGTLNNQYSAIAAGGSIQIGDADISAGAGSGNYGGTTVNNLGRTLYQYQRDESVSTYVWNEGLNEDVGRIAQPVKVYAPVAIGQTGGTIIANQSIRIDAQDLHNQNIAAQNSATGATGGTLGANLAQTDVTGGQPSSVASATGTNPAQTHVTGSQPSSVASATGANPAQPEVTGSPSSNVASATGQPTAVGALQSVVDATGALPKLQLPVSGLYTLHLAPDQPYLVVTDSRLTSYTNFTSSDYMLGQLGLNPQSVEKRLGDGLFEQQLVRNQITQLTGRTFLPGYANAEAQYRALLTQGAHYAQQFDLVPGIALSAAQTDALTSDLVWLVRQTVTLPDGRTTQVLAPVVYLAKTHANDLQPTGALIAADDVAIHAAGSVTNSGTIQGGTQTVVTATDLLNRGGTIASSHDHGTTVVAAANDVVNASGQISGHRVAVLAGHDIVNTTLVDTAGVSGAAGVSQVNTSLLGRQGTIAAADALTLQAGHDLLLHGANLTAGGDAQLTAGHDLLVDTVQSTSQQSMHLSDQRHWEDTSTTHLTSAIAAGGQLVLHSGNDTTLKGAALSAGQDLLVNAGGNLTASTVTNEQRRDNVAVDGRSRQEIDHAYDQQAVGTTLTAGRNATLIAGTDQRTDQGNLSLTGSSVTAGANAATPGAVTLVASRDITLAESREQHDASRQVQSQRGSFISGSSSNDAQDSRANLGVASTLSGDTVQVQAGRDLTIRGSEIVGTQDVTLTAGRQLQITAAQDHLDTTSRADRTENGFFANGGLSVSLGTRSQAEQQTRSETTATGSLIGALHGDLTLTAGNDLHVTGSTLYAGHDINLTGQTVTLDAAYDTVKQTEQQQQRQAGLTLGLTSPVITAVQTGRQMAQSAQHLNGDARLTALAAATAGLAAKNAYDAVGGDLSSTKNLSLNLSLGESHSQSQAQTQTHTAQGSTVTAGNNVTITAAGGPASHIDVIGSTLKAGQDLRLASAGQINLQAAQNTRDSHSTNDGSSAQVGIALSVGTQTGLAFTAGAANQQGHTDETATSWTNTHLTANRTLTLQSGGDTTLQGAVVSGQQVIADIGGDLKLTSLQDTNHSDGQQQSAGLNVSVCVPPLCVGPSSLSAHIDQTKLNGDLASVGEQTGIKAGEGGFQIEVKGKTDLTGSVIASSQSAIDADKNRFESQGPVTQRDLNNTEHYDGKAVGISASNDASQLAGVGVGHAEGDQHSVTRSGIGVATETDTTGALKPRFDAQQVQHELDAQVAITQAFGQHAAQAIGTYAQGKLNEAVDKRLQAAQETDPIKQAELIRQAKQLEADWQEGGAARTGLHLLVGGLTHNLSGAASAGTVALLTPTLAERINQLDAPKEVKDMLLLTASAALGAATGGTAGAATGINVTANNYLKHQEILDLVQARNGCAQGNAAACGEVKRLQALDQARDAELTACQGNGGAHCNQVRQDVRNAYAEIIRKSDETFGVLAIAPFDYKEQAQKTQAQADGTLNALDRALGASKGLAHGLVDGLADLVKGMTIYVKAVVGDPVAGDQLGKTVDNAVQLASTPALWGQVLANATQEMREQIATAYERGDGEALGRIAGQVLSNVVSIGGTVREVGAAAEGVKGVERGVGGVRSVVEELGTTFPTKQLDKKFKHAEDFGLSTTKKNPETLAQYQSALESHMNNAATYQHGTYQYVPDSIVHFNPATNNVVVVSKTGEFVTGWKLTPGTPQFENYLKNGILR